MWWKIISFLDSAGHKAHLPKRVQKRLCHRFDVAAGLYDDSDLDDYYV